MKLYKYSSIVKYKERVKLYKKIVECGYCHTWKKLLTKSKTNRYSSIICNDCLNGIPYKSSNTEELKEIYDNYDKGTIIFD